MTDLDEIIKLRADITSFIHDNLKELNIEVFKETDFTSENFKEICKEYKVFGKYKVFVSVKFTLIKDFTYVLIEEYLENPLCIHRMGNLFDILTGFCLAFPEFRELDENIREIIMESIEEYFTSYLKLKVKHQLDCSYPLWSKYLE